MNFFIKTYYTECVRNSSQPDKGGTLKKIFNFTHRTALFFTLLLVALFALYLAGNKNHFLDSTLLAILRAMSGIAAWHLAFLAFYAVLTAVLTALTRSPSYLPHFCLFAVSFALSLALAFLARALIIASSGI
jgi:hypothetical protein